ncbi:MAG: tripartite tricarboxylate transporter permease, partial [Desulfitobacteriaceae bacterium]|nr:tripartite tricarboxylate transporter permease [Desulfitobacteriaceae bacterium]
TLIFGMSGILGVLALDTNLSVGDATLVPLLSGLFGISVLVESVSHRSCIPSQNLDEGSETKARFLPLCSGAGAGILTGIIPGIGPAQGTVLAQLATRSRSTEDFLVSVSGVNMAKALYSFVALFAIGRPRSGAAVAVGRLLEVGTGELIFLVGVALLAGGIAAMLSLKFGQIAARKMGGLPYRKLCVAVIAGMVGLTVYFCGPMGLPMLATATAIGLLPARFGVRRVHCMGVIMLPCILYFSGLKGSLLAALGL